jgi:hypothetical protein
MARFVRSIETLITAELDRSPFQSPPLDRQTVVARDLSQCD